MRIGIVGSRSRSGPEEADVIARILDYLPAGAVVVSGGAVGVDALADRLARAAGFAVDVIRPDYAGVSGRIAAANACFARNQILAESVDILVAFPASDRRGGTENTIRHAKRANVPVFVSLPGEGSAYAERAHCIRRANGRSADAVDIADVILRPW
ncbi:hypothetical protein [Acuticoccus mangrovi]|uniref:Smf/DprA SLOG domain-containing protein n=1 Tax=Acuticoccus mangrovi TaxID=2796142 RepID=A0A934IFT8_9HYPH|nr:hypothetical protein [Acuticoccus mangrovi]MBJ3775864.1 hypothetical protein [Acuticoccus mangrovi]